MRRKCDSRRAPHYPLLLATRSPGCSKPTPRKRVIRQIAREFNHAETVFVPEQSPEMGPPSFNRLTVTTKHRQLVSAAISGDAIVVSEAIIDA